MQVKKNKWYELSSLCVISIFIMLFGEAYGRSLIGDLYRPITVGVSCLLILSYFIDKYKHIKSHDIIAFRYTYIGIILLLVSTPFWSTFYNSYSYVGIVVAFLVYYINMDRAYKLIVFVAVLCVVLQTYEYYTQSFLFSVVIKDMELDEKLFGGISGVFRAKGVFYGPLNAGTFFVFASLLLLKKNWILFVGLIGCFLANSRTGLVLISMLFLSKILIGDIPKKVVIAFLLIMVAMSSYLLANEQIMTSVSRIGVTGSDDSQSARMFFWTNGIIMYLNYPLSSLIFGDNGLFKMRFGNNPESGWISLLVDNGIVGFLFYFVPLCMCLFRFISKHQKLYICVTVILIVLNFVITAHLSGTNSLLYWLLMFELVNKAVWGYSKIEIIEKRSLDNNLDIKQRIKKVKNKTNIAKLKYIIERLKVSV